MNIKLLIAGTLLLASLSTFTVTASQARGNEAEAALIMNNFATAQANLSAQVSSALSAGQISYGQASQLNAELSNLSMQQNVAIANPMAIQGIVNGYSAITNELNADISANSAYYASIAPAGYTAAVPYANAYHYRKGFPAFVGGQVPQALWNSEGAATPQQARAHWQAVQAQNGPQALWNSEGAATPQQARAHRQAVRAQTSGQGPQALWNSEGAATPQQARAHQQAVQAQTSGQGPQALWNSEGAATPQQARAHQQAVQAQTGPQAGRQQAQGQARQRHQ